MRIDEIIGRKIKGLSSGPLSTQTAIEPNTLDTLHNIAGWKKDISTAKHRHAKIKQQQRRERIKQTGVAMPRLSVYNIAIPLDQVRDFSTNRDESTALSIAKHWKTHKMPPALLDKLFADPKWKAIVMDIWGYAADLLPRVDPDSRKPVVLRSDHPTHRERVRDLQRLIDAYAWKFGIDKSGNPL